MHISHAHKYYISKTKKHTTEQPCGAESQPECSNPGLQTPHYHTACKTRGLGQQALRSPAGTKHRPLRTPRVFSTHRRTLFEKLQTQKDEKRHSPQPGTLALHFPYIKPP